MLRVPHRRQVDSVSCLPACVEAVLAYLGRDVPTEVVRRWCRTSAAGCDNDLAVQGLSDAGIDAELLQCEELADIEECLDAGRPPIVMLAVGDGWCHAVVLCGVSEDRVTCMDPIVGEYVELAREDFLLAWVPLSCETLLIGRRR